MQNLNNPHNNSASWDLQMGFNSEFKGLIKHRASEGYGRMEILLHTLLKTPVVSFTPIQITPGEISHDSHWTGSWVGIRAFSDALKKQMSWTCGKSIHDSSVILSLNSQTWDILIFIFLYVDNCGPRSSVGIVTDYGIDGPGSNAGGDEIFRPVQTGPGAHPASCKMGTGPVPVVKCGRGVLLTTHPILVPRSWKSRAITVPTLWATPGL